MTRVAVAAALGVLGVATIAAALILALADRHVPPAIVDVLVAIIGALLIVAGVVTARTPRGGEP